LKGKSVGLDCVSVYNHRTQNPQFPPASVKRNNDSFSLIYQRSEYPSRRTLVHRGMAVVTEIRRVPVHVVADATFKFAPVTGVWIPLQTLGSRGQNLVVSVTPEARPISETRLWNRIRVVSCH